MILTHSIDIRNSSSYNAHMTSYFEAGRYKFNQIVNLGVKAVNKLGGYEVSHDGLIVLCAMYSIGMLVLANTAEAYHPGSGVREISTTLSWGIPLIIGLVQLRRVLDHNEFQPWHNISLQPPLVFSTTLQSI